MQRHRNLTSVQRGPNHHPCFHHRGRRVLKRRKRHTSTFTFYCGEKERLSVPVVVQKECLTRRRSDCSIATFRFKEVQCRSTILTFEYKTERERLIVTTIIIKEEEVPTRCRLLRWRRADTLPIPVGTLNIESHIACAIPQDMLQCSMSHFILADII